MLEAIQSYFLTSFPRVSFGKLEFVQEIWKRLLKNQKCYLNIL